MDCVSLTWTLLILSLSSTPRVLGNHLHNYSYEYSYEQSDEEGHDMGHVNLDEHNHHEPPGHDGEGHVTEMEQHHRHDPDEEYDSHEHVVIDMPLGDEEPISEAPQHLLKESDPNSPAISFSAEHEFSGAELFFDGHGLSLPKPFKTKSHRFKGGVNWTIYPGANYSGSAMCLISDPGHPVTGNGHHDITVGSIRRGCWCNDSMTMVKPKPRSRFATVPSGVQFWSERNAVGGSAYTDGRETRFPYPIEMRSFRLLGKWIQWTVFSKADFHGDSSCLAADREGGTANYMFTNIPRPFTVSSMQQACVSTTSFEFAGVEDTLEEGKESEKVQVSENEVPVMPEGPGTGPGSGGSGGSGTGKGGTDERVVEGSEVDNTFGMEGGTSDNGDAKGRGGSEGAGASAGTKFVSEFVVIGLGFIFSAIKN